MITVTGKLACSNSVEAEILLSHLEEHTRLTREEPGCLSFLVSRTADPLVWSVDEAFVDAEAYRAHQTRTRASAWYKATAHIRRDYRVTGL